MRQILLIIFSIITLGFADNADAENSDGDYVVILHGIARSSSHMEDLSKYLGKRGYDVINLDYPSTDHKLEKLVDIIHKKVAAKLTKDKPVHFVGYSMGGVLVRAIIHKYPQKKLGRVVQLAAPNNGSEVADFLEENWFYKKIYGPAGKELTTNNAATEKLLGKVNYELGVIAGNSTIDPISSIIIPGDDDGKVSVKSTKFNGMKDHVIVSASHTFFPSNKTVHQQTEYFLKNGKFRRKVDK